MIRRLLLFTSVIASATFLAARSNLLRAQELNCNVQVLSPQIQSSDKRIFETLQKSVYEFMNNRKWTNDVFKFEERIECSILINITERSMDEFKATMQIQARRPVFNSSYNSLLLNFSDNDIHFKYLEFDPLDYSDNSHLSNLTSILAFYAYIIIGIDYDTFSRDGGTTFFHKAQTIVNNAQSANEQGWKAFESTRNRFWLSDGLNDQIYKPFRDCMYSYHRTGLDMMNDNLDAGRNGIAESLEKLEKVHNSKPASFILQVFFDAKADEIVNIFTESYANDKTRIVNLLNKIDPANTTKYQKIIKG